jgi:hypothetical protein
MKSEARTRAKQARTISYLFSLRTVQNNPDAIDIPL